MNEQQPATSEPATRLDPPRPRRPYRKPRLTEYGSIAKLTQGTLTVGGDGPGGGLKKSRCL
jgi:hypothetical protein